MISRTHWLETAGKCRFSSEDMEDILQECCEKTSPVIELVSRSIPAGFPEEIAATIFSGLERAAGRMELKLNCQG